MHPDILREVTSRRGYELQERAHQARISRMVSRARRARRRGHGADELDGFAAPAIPDYVDDSFRTEETVVSEPGQAPAAQHAA